MLKRFCFALACLPALTATAAMPQTAPVPAAKAAPATTVAPLTVQASPSPKVIQKQSRSFVQTYAAAPNPEIDQIGRWHDGVCVQVVGLLQADQAAMIKARIEGVAREVGLPAPWTTPEGCKANVEIVFTDQPQAVMDTVALRREYLLGYYHLHDRDRLKTVTHPIQAWYVTETIGDGLNFGSIIWQRLLRVIDDPEETPPDGCGESHFSACLTSAFNNVFIVADSKALEGKEIGLVADDMVMLALSQPKSLDGCNALPSVIDRFAKSACPGRDPPDGLTPGDAAYLTALYASDPEARKASEQSDIALQMAKILIKASTEPPSLPPAPVKAR